MCACGIVVFYSLLAEAQDKAGETALHWYLRLRVPGHGFSRVSLLHRACLNGHEGAARLLLQQAPELLQARSVSGSTPLHLAVVNAHAACTSLLLGMGADPAAKDNRRANTRVM